MQLPSKKWFSFSIYVSRESRHKTKAAILKTPPAIIRIRKHKEQVMKAHLSLLASAVALGSNLAIALPSNAETTYLIFGTYRQPDGVSKPMVSPYSSPSVQVIPMLSMEQCEAAGEEIFNEIYKPVWFFDGRWTCVEGK